MNAQEIRAAAGDGGCEVRTRHGRWRSVCAVYSDDTFGTVRAEGNSKAGRFTILHADDIAEVRGCDDG